MILTFKHATIVAYLHYIYILFSIDFNFSPKLYSTIFVNMGWLKIFFQQYNNLNQFWIILRWFFSQVHKSGTLQIYFYKDWQQGCPPWSMVEEKSRRQLFTSYIAGLGQSVHEKYGLWVSKNTTEEKTLISVWIENFLSPVFSN